MSTRRIKSRILKFFLAVITAMAIALSVFFVFATDVTSNVDSYIYELPFETGSSHKVVQGYGGLFSHRYIAAIDFGMPIGTFIHAARGGVVYSYKDDSNEGGIFDAYKGKANFIIIKHDDGSFGCYWHLQKEGVLVKRGRVFKGQKIAVSGATGQVIKPHLHFSVKRKLSYEMNSFLKTKFRTNKGITFLERGKSYKRPLR